jgi:hypothetical protein
MGFTTAPNQPGPEESLKRMPEALGKPASER